MGQLAAQHFWDCGLRHFAFFSTGRCWWSEEFFDAYQATLTGKKQTCLKSPFCEKKNLASLPIMISPGQEPKIKEWLKSLPKPIGIFCPSDGQAIYALNICQFAGLTVPEEIAVLGVENNSVLCNTTSPPLSSIAGDGYQTGYLAAQLLDRRMSGRKLPKLPVIIQPLEVIKRQSTDHIAVGDPDVSEALLYIRTHAMSHLTVKEIAAHIDVSTRTLIRKFHDVLQRTPESEMIRVRMEAAKFMLRDTEMSIAMIARNTGYSSAEYFRKAFKREIGIGPRHYRILLQAEQRRNIPLEPRCEKDD